MAWGKIEQGKATGGKRGGLKKEKRFRRKKKTKKQIRSFRYSGGAQESREDAGHTENERERRL